LTFRIEWPLSAAAITIPFVIALVFVLFAPSQVEFAEHFTLQQCSYILGLSMSGMLASPILFVAGAWKAFVKLRSTLNYSIALSLLLLAIISVLGWAWIGAACGGMLAG
jgi:hypothetical protein